MFPANCETPAQKKAYEFLRRYMAASPEDRPAMAAANTSWDKPQTIYRGEEYLAFQEAYDHWCMALMAEEEAKETTQPSRPAFAVTEKMLRAAATLEMEHGYEEGGDSL